MKGQLELPLAEENHDADASPTGFQARGCGWMLLDLLGQSGWEIVVGPGFGGGVLVVAEYRTEFGSLLVQRQGVTVADIACQVVKECQRLVRARP